MSLVIFTPHSVSLGNIGLFLESNLQSSFILPTGEIGGFVCSLFRPLDRNCLKGGGGGGKKKLPVCFVKATDPEILPGHPTL